MFAGIKILQIEKESDRLGELHKITATVQIKDDSGQSFPTKIIVDHDHQPDQTNCGVCNYTAAVDAAARKVALKKSIKKTAIKVYKEWAESVGLSQAPIITVIDESKMTAEIGTDTINQL